MDRHSRILFFILYLSSFSTYGQDTFVFSTIDGHPAVGLGEAIVSEAYAQIGKSVIVERLPAARAITMASLGKYDGELGRIEGMLVDFDDLFPVSTPMYILTFVAFSSQQDIRVDGWESLRPYRIGITRGILFTEKNTEGMNRYRATSATQLFRMLDAGRFDVAISMKVVGLLTLKKLKIEDIHALESPLETKKVLHFLHRKHLALIPEISGAFLKMEKSGRISELTKQYIHKIKKEFK